MLSIIEGGKSDISNLYHNTMAHMLSSLINISVMIPIPSPTNPHPPPLLPTVDMQSVYVASIVQPTHGEADRFQSNIPGHCTCPLPTLIQGAVRLGLRTGPACGWLAAEARVRYGSVSLPYITVFLRPQSVILKRHGAEGSGRFVSDLAPALKRTAAVLRDTFGLHFFSSTSLLFIFFFTFTSYSLSSSSTLGLLVGFDPVQQ